MGKLMKSCWKQSRYKEISVKKKERWWSLLHPWSESFRIEIKGSQRRRFSSAMLVVEKYQTTDCQLGEQIPGICTVKTKFSFYLFCAWQATESFSKCLRSCLHVHTWEQGNIISHWSLSVTVCFVSNIIFLILQVELHRGSKTNTFLSASD